MGLEDFKKWRKEKKRAEKKAAQNTVPEKIAPGEPMVLPPSTRAVGFETFVRDRQANDHIVPVDPDEED